MIGRPKTPIRMLPPSQIVPRPARVARGRRGRAGGGGRQQKQRVGGRGDESRGTRQRSGRLDAGARVRADVLLLGVRLRQDRDSGPTAPARPNGGVVCTRESALGSQHRHEHPPLTPQYGSFRAAPHHHHRYGPRCAVPRQTARSSPARAAARTRRRIRTTQAAGRLQVVRCRQGRQTMCGGPNAAQTMRRAARPSHPHPPRHRPPHPSSPPKPCARIGRGVVEEGGRHARGGNPTDKSAHARTSGPGPLCAHIRPPPVPGAVGVSHHLHASRSFEPSNRCLNLKIFVRFVEFLK